MQRFKTVLGEIPAKELGITLAHEHICCYNEHLYRMAGEKYLDKKRLKEVSARYLRTLREQYGLSTFIDCTPVNIGRDIALLKEVSEQAGVHILCSTGFYYTQEPILAAASPELLAEYMIADCERNPVGIIKCAVQEPELDRFDEKLLKAAALAQKSLRLPLILHTNAKNKNGLKALQLLLAEGVQPQAITAGHLSDTEDLDYIKQIADYGCFIGLDRLYGKASEEYIAQKVQTVTALCDAGCEGQILLSHDALFFNGFEAMPTIKEQPRFGYCFHTILPRLPMQTAEKIMKENPLRMLSCGRE